MLAFEIIPAGNEGIFNKIEGVSLSWMIRESLTRRHPSLGKALSESRRFEDSITPKGERERDIALALGLSPDDAIPLPPGMRLRLNGRGKVMDYRGAALMIRADLLPSGVLPESVAEDIQTGLNFAAMGDGQVSVRYRRQRVWTDRPGLSNYLVRGVDLGADLDPSPSVAMLRHLQQALFLSLVADPRADGAVTPEDARELYPEITECVATPYTSALTWDVRFQLCASLAAPIGLGLEANTYDLTSAVSRRHRSAA